MIELQANDRLYLDGKFFGIVMAAPTGSSVQVLKCGLVAIGPGAEIARLPDDAMKLVSRRVDGTYDEFGRLDLLEVKT